MAARLTQGVIALCCSYLGRGNPDDAAPTPLEPSELDVRRPDGTVVRLALTTTGVTPEPYSATQIMTWTVPLDDSFRQVCDLSQPGMYRMSWKLRDSTSNELALLRRQPEDTPLAALWRWRWTPRPPSSPAPSPTAAFISNVVAPFGGGDALFALRQGDAPGRLPWGGPILTPCAWRPDSRPPGACRWTPACKAAWICAPSSAGSATLAWRPRDLTPSELLLVKGQLSPLDLNNTPPDNPESAVPRLHLGVLLGARPTTLLCWGPLSPRRSSPATPRGAGALRSPRSPRFPASSRRPASCASPGPIKRRRSGKSCCPRDQANAPSLSLLLSDTLRGRSDVDMTRPGVYRVVWQAGDDMSNELFVKVMPPPAADASPAPAGPACALPSRRRLPFRYLHPRSIIRRTPPSHWRPPPPRRWG